MAIALLSAGSVGQAEDASLPKPPHTREVAFLDGVWIGPAAITLPDGRKMEFEQMERVGPMMGGEVRVMEGRGRDSTGKTVFNAFSIFSQNAEGEIEMRTYTMGHQNSRRVELRDGRSFAWEIPASTHTVRYTAEVADGVWKEKGERIGADGKSVPFFEMTLTRVADTRWPEDNPLFVTK
ncbi:hypothetical protein [Tsuneonella sp. SYSU-LHT278]|uniref:hypothetical protein n=1 Tax=Tsuneonella sediminis TaxID=3416089 RepID=UPI003F791892